VQDLQAWTRFKGNPADGMTTTCLNLSWLDRMALRFALWKGQLGTPLAWVYASRDVALTKDSAAIAVMSVTERDPQALFECGRRLLRAWVAINACGFSYHPISIVIDQAPTTLELAQLTALDQPVAIFRIGYTPKAAAWSNRRPTLV
jgi:hypothetical protein